MKRIDVPSAAFKPGPDPRRSRGPGRPPGQSMVKAKARECFLELVEGNAHKVQGWLDEIERNNGALPAMKVFLELAEFCIPKMARMELTGEDGKPIAYTEIRRVIVDPKKDDS